MAYVRLHGRNARQWYQHEQAGQRYDYQHSPEELADWLPRLRELEAAAPLTLAYFNNTPRAQGIEYSRPLGAMSAPG